MNIRKKFLNEKGFTLIEMIASLVILVIMGALVIIITTKIVEGFIFTKMNAATSQKGQIALGRLTKEFTNIISVSSGGASSITFDSRNYITGGTQTSSVWESGNTILIGSGSGDILVDNVSSFVLTYYDDYVTQTLPTPSWSPDTSKEIEITLSLVGANDVESVFTTRVVPRNL